MSVAGSATHWLIGAGTVIGALLVIWKVVLPVWRGGRRVVGRLTRMLDVVLGTPAIPDPDRPGELLKDATPDIGVRMTSTETLLREVVLGAVAEAKEHAVSSARSAQLAAEAAAAAQASAAKVEGLPDKVDRLTETVERWQSVDRTRAEMGTAVIAELARDKS